METDGQTDKQTNIYSLFRNKLSLPEGSSDCSTRQQINIMLSHGIVNAIAVTGQLSLIDGVTNAIDVQVAKNKGDIEQEIVILS